MDCENALFISIGKINSFKINLGKAFIDLMQHFKDSHVFITVKIYELFRIFKKNWEDLK